MAHPKPHPLAGRRVVTNSGLALGEQVYVVDWCDRAPALAVVVVRGDAAALDAVLVRDRLGPLFVPAHDLPSYDPVPVGYVS